MVIMMDEIINLINQLFEVRTQQIKTGFLSQNNQNQTMIKAFAALTHKNPESAILDIYVFESYVKKDLDLIASNIVTGRNDYWDFLNSGQKTWDKQLEYEFENYKRDEYLNKYGRDLEIAFRALADLAFGMDLSSAINYVICKETTVRQQLSYINLSNINSRNLKSILREMNDYYTSQCSGYKPIKTFINKAWNNENLSIVETGAGGAIWGAVLGGPIGMVAGAALASMWASNKKKETYR